MPTRKRAASIRIREIRSGSDPAFGAAYDLLRRVFPRSELLPRRDWQTAMQEREAGLWTDLDWHVLVAERAGRVIGTATGSYLGNLNVGIIGYIVLAARSRARGLGPRLRHGLHQAFERDARRIRGRPLDALVGEVREDNPWLRHLVRREGAIALDFPYYQPSLDVDRTPVPLVLYYQPLPPLRRRSLPAAMVRRLLYSLWRRPYRVAHPLSRPAFRHMLRALAGRKRVGQRALPDLAASTGDR